MRKLTEYPTLSLKSATGAGRTRARKWRNAGSTFVLCGWPAMWDFNIANARYLCPIGGNAEHNVLVFPLESRRHIRRCSPTLLEGWRPAKSGSPTCGRAKDFCRGSRTAERTED